MAQVPPPPQAEGKKIFWPPSVDNKLVPEAVTIGLLSSPLMMILTSPVETNFDCANRRINTSSKMIAVNATMDVIITEPMNISFNFWSGLIPNREHKYI
jgi:hypothetical protein